MSCLREGINPYRVRVIRLKEQNVEAFLEHLRSKPDHRLKKEDLVPIVLMPLMDGKMPQKERARRGFEILKRSYPHVSKEDLERMQAVLYVLSCKFLTEEEKMNVKELIATDFLTKLFIEDGKVLGRAEGKAEAVLYLLEDIGTVGPKLSDRIAEEKDEAVLEKWLKLAAKAKSVEEFERTM